MTARDYHRELRDLDVHVWMPGAWERPTDAQWDAVLSDIGPVTAGLRYYVGSRNGICLTLVWARPVTDWTPYNGLPKGVLGGNAEPVSTQTALGWGWPLPIVRVAAAYPDDGLGNVAHAGINPCVHEMMHCFDQVKADARGYPLSRQPAFTRVWQQAKWWDGLAAKNPAEAFAKMGELVCTIRAGDPRHALPPADRVDPLIVDYFTSLARDCGWGW